MVRLNEMARRLLPEHMELVRKVAAYLAWNIEYDLETGLCFVEMIGGKGVGMSDPYLLRLEFDYYPVQPPSALFVDPLTRQRGTIEEQRLFWPIFNKQPGPTRINITQDAKVGGLYLCYPYTYEYEVTHSERRWNPAKHSVVTTLVHLQNALSSIGYGRYAA